MTLEILKQTVALNIKSVAITVLCDDGQET